MAEKICQFCQKPFAPNKYSPRQNVCSLPDCQRKRQLDSMRAWRGKNPHYFKYDEAKGQVWLQMQRRRSRVWREKNPEKVRSYRQTHMDEYRRYMRDYMREYRKRRKESGSDSSASSATAVEEP